MNNFNQGGFNNQNGFQNQGGFNNPQPNGGFNPNQNQGGGNNNKSSYNNHMKVQAVVNLVDDPESKPVGQNGSKVASATVAFNHRGDNAAADFWTIEAWANQNSTAIHDFLMDYCNKGRQVFVEGVPHLKRRKRQNNGQDVVDQNGKAIYDYYPTIRVQTLLGLQGGSNRQDNQSGFNNQQNNGGQQNAGAQNNGFNQQPNGFGAPGGQPNGGFGAPNNNFGGQAPNQFGAPQFAGQQ